MVEKITLNAAQKQAVMHNTGPVLVVAGAGTGKTAVISLRIAHLIQKRNIPQENILALTFTEKAAAEMQDRVDRLLPFGVVDSDILTFHGLGDKILREFGFELGLPSDFVVMSNFQQSIVMQEIISNLSLQYYKTLSNPYSFVTALLQFISRLKDENISAEDFEKFVLSQKTELTRLDKKEFLRIKELSEIYISYNDECLRRGMIDYGDQIVKVILLLEQFPSIISLLQKKYEYILVDEYQDTNFAQSYLLKLLSKEHHNIMVVGDDDQSIYRFRGAAISNILGFTRDYPEAKQIVLTHNYRSSQKVLDSAYTLINNNNPYRLEFENNIDKKLIGKKISSEVSTQTYETMAEEMKAIAEWVHEKKEKHSLQYSDFAVLLRKNNQASIVAQAFLKQDIPFMVSESQNLFEQAEIKVLLHFIYVLSDPTNSAALYGLLVSDLYKISLHQIAELSAQANKKHIPLEEYLRSINDLPDIFTIVLSTLDDFRGASNSEGAGQLLYRYIESSGYLSKLVQEAESDSLAVTKLQNISQFFGIIKDFELASEYNTVYSLWQYLQQIKSSDTNIVSQTSPLDQDAVRVMTIHKAKGLEFTAVCMIDLIEQTFPSKNMSDKIRTPEGLL
ncbi:UvrD-helicase domain-containing protein, partial [Candidatus Saccharibacteria bacterium]|nr:UvrD-helicase domain-containing protein [Candidatus Saccharibacteria bacterium]